MVAAEAAPLQNNYGCRHWTELSETLCWEGVGGFGDDDPGDEIGDGADAGEEGDERSDDADEIEVPTVVEGEAGADSGDHAVVARAGELVGVRIEAGGGGGGAAEMVAPQAGQKREEGSIVCRTVNRTWSLREILFCHRDGLEEMQLRRQGPAFSTGRRRSEGCLRGDNNESKDNNNGKISHCCAPHDDEAAGRYGRDDEFQRKTDKGKQRQKRNGQEVSPSRPLTMRP